MTHPNFKPTKVFYGWWVVAASFLIAFYVGGVVFYGFTAIFVPIANEFGWSYTQISLAASLRGLESSLLAPLIGTITDRWGPRRMIFGGGIITALGLFLLSRTTSLGMFYGAFFVISMGMSACAMTVLMTTVANWFRRRIGLATGIAGCGFAFGGLLVPLMVRLIDMYEWRMTVAILAGGMLVIVMPLSLLFRHKPEQYGYLPDGEEKATTARDNTSAQLSTVEISIGARQALKTSTFWRIALAYTCHTIIVGSMFTHIMPYLGSIGVVRSVSTLVATATPLASIGGRLGFGWLGDRANKRKIAAAAWAMTCLGLVSFGCMSMLGTWLLVSFIILFGIGYGGNMTLRTSLTRDLFGRGSFGTVFGLLIGINMLGNIVGPT